MIIFERGRTLGFELMSPHNIKQCSGSISSFLCWAFVIAAAPTFFTFQVALAQPDTTIDLAPDEWFITRDMWLAPPFNATKMTTEFEPLRLVVIGHTVTAECKSFVNCAASMRNLQSYFDWFHDYDLPYNFVIGNDGRVYEGRGWGVAGAHVIGYNSCSLALAFIGDYREGLPSYSKVTPLQLERAQLLLEEGIKLGHLHPSVEVLGARDLKSSVSPGENLYNEIRKWPNYAHDNIYRNRTCQEIHDLFKD